MELTILLVLFIPIIIYALRQKDWYICLLFAFYPVLPETFAIEVSGSLPLLTGSRILILLNLIICLKLDHGKLHIQLPKYLSTYFLGVALVLLVNLPKYWGGISDIFNLFFEQFLLVTVICRLVKNHKQFFKCLNFLTLGFSANCIIGILQTIAGIDVSTPLNIVARRSESGLALRMGLTRAAGTTGSAILFACECGLMALLILFIYENTKKKQYLIVFGISIITLMCTMSRSSILAFSIVFSLIIVMRYRQVAIRYFKFLPVVLLFILGLYIVFPALLEKILEPVRSILNILGANYELSSMFGDNANNATNSRSFQWSSIFYMLEHGNLFWGYGYKAYTRGMIHFYYDGYGAWDIAQALDVGFVKLIAERGIIGFCLHLVLLFKIVKTSLKKGANIHGNINFYQTTIFMIVLYVLSNILSACIDNEFIWLYFGMFCIYQRLGNFNTNTKSSKLLGFT